MFILFCILFIFCNVAVKAYAVLDDRSERTFILHDAVQKLRLVGEPEDLVFCTVRQNTQFIHWAAVTFIVSPTVNPSKAYKIRNAFIAKALGMAEHTHPVSPLAVLPCKCCASHWLWLVPPHYAYTDKGPLQGPAQEFSSHLSPK